MRLARITAGLFPCVWRAACSLLGADAFLQGLVQLDEVAAVFRASPLRFPRVQCITQQPFRPRSLQQQCDCLCLGKPCSNEASTAGSPSSASTLQASELQRASNKLRFGLDSSNKLLFSLEAINKLFGLEASNKLPFRLDASTQ